MEKGGGGGSCLIGFRSVASKRLNRAQACDLGNREVEREVERERSREREVERKVERGK